MSAPQLPLERTEGGLRGLAVADYSRITSLGHAADMCKTSLAVLATIQTGRLTDGSVNEIASPQVTRTRALSTQRV
jgi:hypothetical protein